MDNLSKLLWKTLAKKNLWWLWRWALVNSITSTFLNELWIKHNFHWKIKFNVYFLKVSNSTIWNLLFLKKKLLLKRINSKLEKMWFWTIKDIRIS